MMRHLLKVSTIMIRILLIIIVIVPLLLPLGLAVSRRRLIKLLNATNRDHLHLLYNSRDRLVEVLTFFLLFVFILV